MKPEKPSATPSPKSAKPLISCTTAQAHVRHDFDNETHRPGAGGCVYQPVELPRWRIFTGQIAAALLLATTRQNRPIICRSSLQGIALLLEAGVPPGVVQLLPGRGETVGAQFTADNRVRAVMFTGSQRRSATLRPDSERFHVVSMRRAAHAGGHRLKPAG
ncbi:aldehyde dehydrogenase family protein [Escherichia coli]